MPKKERGNRERRKEGEYNIGNIQEIKDTREYYCNINVIENKVLSVRMWKSI